MEPFEIKPEEVSGIPVIRVSGFFNDRAGDQLNAIAQEILRKGKNKIVLDFSATKVINSPGTSLLTELVWVVNDDFKGKILLSGLDKLKLNVFKTVGIIPPAEVVTDIETGVKNLLGAP